MNSQLVLGLKVQNFGKHKAQGNIQNLDPRMDFGCL